MTDSCSHARAQSWWGGPLVAGLLATGAAVRALRFFAPFHWPFHWDETQVAVPALLTLRGDIPVTAGPEYFGAAPWYPLAAWFAAIGMSTLALDLYSYAIGLLIFWTTWLILRRFLGRTAALYGLAIVAVSPLFLAQWSLMAANHVPNLLIGNLCVLATHVIFVADPGRSRTILVLGILAGLGWWTSPLVVVYVAPFAVLALRTGLVWRPRVAWFAVGLFVGGLPQWLYEFAHFPSAKFALHEGGGVEVVPLRERLAAIAGDFLPRLLGLDLRAGRAWIVAFVVVAVPLWLLAVAWAARRDRRELVWAFGGRGGIGRGHVILWIVAATNLALVLATKRAIDHYYLLPLYSVLPCWMGECLDGLRRRRPLVAGVALTALLVLAVWPNWRDSLGTTPSDVRRWAILERRVAALFPWLRGRGLDRVYVADTGPGLVSYGATYLSGGRVVFADLWREPVVANGQLVDAALNPPIVATDASARPLRASLKGIGVGVRETRVGGLRILEPEPRFARSFVALPRTGWTVTASDNGERAADLLDGDVATVWDSKRAQAPGQWLALDLGASQVVTRVDLLAIDWQNMPGGFRVEVSSDGRRWETVVTVPEYWGPLFFSEQHPFLRVRRGRVQAVFPPVRTRHVRIVETASVAHRSWSGRELFAYGPGGPRAPVPRDGEIAAALRRERIDFVYASHWLSARVRVESRGAIAAQESNINLSDSSRTEPDPAELVPLHVEKGTGILLGADSDLAAVRQALEGQSVQVRERVAGPYPLLVLTPEPAPRRLDKAAWRASASENGAHAPRAIDGDRRTQWMSAGPGRPDLTLVLDLGGVRDVRGVEVRPGLPGRELRVASSLDGTAWTPVEPVAWAGALYWTGSELLRNGGPKWAVAFSPTRLRYLRLSPAAPLRDPWTVAEVDCLE